MAKKESIANELAGSLRHMWRHRSGVKVLGKTIIEDNRVPGLILDTFDNLRFETKDKRKPVIVSKKKTEYGWYLVIKLPPGISFLQVKRKLNWFSDAVNGFVRVDWLKGNLHMDIQTNTLPTLVDYQWNPELYKDMELPIPIGFTQKGLEVFDLCESPHMLIGGQTGWGKTMSLHCIANALLPKAWVCISDPKRIDFRYLKKQILLARDDVETQNLLMALNKEYDKRIAILEKADVSITKIQEYDGSIPYIVLIIDEIAELSKDTMVLLNRLARLARATGISLIGATQRPSVDVIPGSTRDLFEARLCFKVGSEISSRVILGEEGSMAAWLPPVKGRAIFKFGHEFKEVQTMFLSKDQRKKVHESLELRRWDIEPSTKRLLPR